MKLTKICNLKMILAALLFINFNIKKTEIQNLIVFKLHSDSITKEANREIIAFGNEFKTIFKDDDSKYIELRNYTCNFELNKNALIGFKRAKKIYDILENECLIPRSKVHYIDISNRDLLGVMGKEQCESMMKTKRVGIKLEVH
jgi:hypothetical protein